MGKRKPLHYWVSVELENEEHPNPSKVILDLQEEFGRADVEQSSVFLKLDWYVNDESLAKKLLSKIKEYLKHHKMTADSFYRPGDYE